MFIAATVLPADGVFADEGVGKRYTSYRFLISKQLGVILTQVTPGLSTPATPKCLTVPVKKYILAESSQILSLPEVQKMKLPDIAVRADILHEKLFILKINRRYHLINSTIKQFLDAFTQPVSLNQVIAQFAQMAGCHTYEIRAIMTRFLEDMLDRGVLISHSQQLKSARAAKSRKLLSEIKQLAEYRIIQEISHKKDLQIFQAEHLESRRQVALKFLKIPKLLSRAELRKQKDTFLQEFRLMQELKGHPNICQCFGYVNSPKYCYGILEFIAGESLRSHIRNKQPKLSERIKLISQILSAVSFIHQRNVLHGDIHLSNFMVDHNYRSIKLIDFNLSNRELPQKGEVVWQGGVFQYIPPEKLDTRAFGLVKSRSDYCSEVFQLGVVIYFVLYEKMPFEAFTWPELSQKIQQEEPAYLSTTPQGKFISPALISVLKRSLKKSPGERYVSAKSLFQSWEEAQNPEMSLAIPSKY